MYGLTDDIADYREEIKELKGDLKDLKTLTKLLLDNPNNEAVRTAAKIAIGKIKS